MNVSVHYMYIPSKLTSECDFSQVHGIHISMFNGPMGPRAMLQQLLATIFPSFFYKDYEYKKFVPASAFLMKLIREQGYMHLQGTKPDTIGLCAPF